MLDWQQHAKAEPAQNRKSAKKYEKLTCRTPCFSAKRACRELVEPGVFWAFFWGDGFCLALQTVIVV
jgi:hypothetical protein